MISKLAEEKVQRRASRARGRHSFYASNSLSADAENIGSVSIDVSFRPGSFDLDILREAIVTTTATSGQSQSKAFSGDVTKVLREALKRAVSEIFSRSFSQEVGEVVDAYRVMLRESLAKGEDPELLAALNRARLQEKILASTSMVDQAQACQLLGMSTTNPSATMKRKEDRHEVLRFTIDGRPSYPLFQFDVEGRRVYPVVGRLIAAKPKDWSDFRLLHWLTRPHLDFESTPAEAFQSDEDEVMAAFEREIEPAVHG